jgi:hypothetical protein
VLDKYDPLDDYNGVYDGSIKEFVNKHDIEENIGIKQKLCCKTWRGAYYKEHLLCTSKSINPNSYLHSC